MKILLIGASKSGKSMLAQKLIKALFSADGSTPYYWATMEPTDGEDRRRIEKHLEDRVGWGFETIECAKRVASALPLLDGEVSVLFDSITALTANEMFGTVSSGYLPFPDPQAGERALRELLLLAERANNVVFVCDDLFKDGITFDASTENYRRALANICRSLAESCDTVCEVVCGLPLIHKGSLPKI